MRSQFPSLAAEPEVGRLAARQHGLITRGQLLALGFSSAAISRRVALGRLHRLHPGVYAVGHPALTIEAARLAAVLACGPGALASHTTAAAIWGLRPDNGQTVHVTIEGDRRPRAASRIRVHRVRTLKTDDRAVQSATPVTAVARTLVDLGDVVTPDHVRRAFVRAEQLQLLDMYALDAAVRRSTTRRGARIVIELLRAYDPRWSQTRSDLELRMLDLLAVHQLPEPTVNDWVDGRFMIDFLWRDQRLAVETDGAASHSQPSAVRADARRDHALCRLGFRVVRVPYRQLSDEPEAVARRLTAALSPA